jgi:hypothetical protein
MRMNNKHTPLLDYNQEFGRWCLRLSHPLSEEDASYEMMINVSWGDPHTYRFIKWVDGEWFEVCTKADYDQRVQDIAEHEGDAVAKLWALEQEQVIVVRDTHPVFALRAHWEAIMTLELLYPMVTLKEWHGKPMSADLRSRLDALRKAEWEAEMKAMAEEEAAEASEV